MRRRGHDREEYEGFADAGALSADDGRLSLTAAHAIIPRCSGRHMMPQGSPDDAAVGTDGAASIIALSGERRRCIDQTSRMVEPFIFIRASSLLSMVTELRPAYSRHLLRRRGQVSFAHYGQ